MIETTKCDIGVLHVLKHSSVKDIDYLVAVLTDNGKGRVALSTSVKDLLLEEKSQGKYSENALRHLVNEFQEYGGHSVLNLFRKEPVAYEEILTDVHKKLNGKDSKTKSVWQKEREIVLSLFGEEWSLLTDAQRWERCTNTKVLTGFFDMQAHLNFDEKGVLIGGLSAAESATAWRALGGAVLGATVATVLGTAGMAAVTLTEAYRITIPFVAQIAMLKMKNTAVLTN